MPKRNSPHPWPFMVTPRPAPVRPPEGLVPGTPAAAAFERDAPAPLNNPTNGSPDR